MRHNNTKIANWMKMITYKMHACVRMMALAAALVCGIAAQAQQHETYTLTNGRVYWYEGADGAGHTTAMATDKATGQQVHRWNSEDITQITVMGDAYLALDITDAEHPTVVAKRHTSDASTDEFDPYCVWYRTAATGFYYQVHGDYYYYLMGTKGRLSVLRVKIGDANDNTTTWYNWDFGAAVTEVAYRDGSREESYYWVIYDDYNYAPSLGQWTMSTVSDWERPEYIYFNGITNTGDPVADSTRDAINMTYAAPRTVTVGEGASAEDVIIPEGNGALFLPVKITSHDKEIENLPDDRGLTAIKLFTTTTDVEQYTMKYGETVDVAPQMTIPSGYNVHVTPEYIEYKQEVYRYGINTSWRQRTQEGVFNSAGTAQYATYYYYPESGSSTPTRHATEPTAVESALVVKTDTLVSGYEYTLDNPSRRYLEIDATNPSNVTLSCVSVPPVGAVAHLTVKVFYTNGTSQSRMVDITMSNYVEPSPMPAMASDKGPVVKGFVCGGGRMANVGGNTSVTVHSCDSIYAIYGGNDIAGWVQGDDGATVRLGTVNTSAEHPVHIGYVYGGGCGYYTYQGINPGYNDATDTY